MLQGGPGWAVQLLCFSPGLCVAGLDFPLALVSWNILEGGRASCCISWSSPAEPGKSPSREGILPEIPLQQLCFFMNRVGL